jgi:hypothetical protein
VLLLRATGQGVAAVVVFAVGITGWTTGVAADAVFGSLAPIGREGDEGLIQGLYQLQGFLTAKGFWFAAGFALVAGLASWCALPRWYAVLSLVAGVLFALGGIAVRRAGFLSPLDGLTMIAFLALLVWTLATCVLVWREQPGATTVAI